MRTLTELQRRYGIDFARAREIQEIEQAREWMPIRSAPMSGEPVLLWWQRCKHPTVGRWIEDETGTGWMCEGDACMPKNQNDCTHWMPLPSGPSQYVPDELDRERAYECGKANAGAEVRRGAPYPPALSWGFSGPFRAPEK